MPLLKIETRKSAMQLTKNKVKQIQIKIRSDEGTLLGNKSGLKIKSLNWPLGGNGSTEPVVALSQSVLLDLRSFIVRAGWRCCDLHIGPTQYM